MVAETDDKEERTEESEETGETLSADTALIGWLGAIHSEIRAQRAEFREEIQAARAEFREELQAARVEFREELRETRSELSERIDRVEERGIRTEERVARIEGGIEAERARKNRVIMWLGIGVGIFAALATAAGVTVGLIGLLN